MKKTLLLLFLFVSQLILAQVQAYYNDVNLTLTGMDLFSELSHKVTVTQTNSIPYTSSSFDTWDALILTDANPLNSSQVLLIYGWADGSGTDVTTDRTRTNSNHGGSNGQWNREHVFAKSLAIPALSTSNPGPGTDINNLRAADVQRNAYRGNLKFATGSGNSNFSNSGWYPGDEWKGDVARIVMFMYLRYHGNGTSYAETKCLPTNVGIGTTNSVDSNMIDLFLQWNAEDPVSDEELQRNPVTEQYQGNRNPFIDDPALATEIWGGPQAQDTWGTLAVANYQTNTFKVYPNPSNNHSVNVVLNNANQADIVMYNVSGQLIYHHKINTKNAHIDHLPSGFYMLKITTNKQSLVKKVIIN